MGINMLERARAMRFDMVVVVVVIVLSALWSESTLDHPFAGGSLLETRLTLTIALSFPLQFLFSAMTRFLVRACGESSVFRLSPWPWLLFYSFFIWHHHIRIVLCSLGLGISVC